MKGTVAPPARRSATAAVWAGRRSSSAATVRVRCAKGASMHRGRFADGRPRCKAHCPRAARGPPAKRPRAAHLNPLKPSLKGPWEPAPTGRKSLTAAVVYNLHPDPAGPSPLKREASEEHTMPTSADHIRNLAIIAHIDHGKTTLIDSIFRAAHTFRDNARIEERVMDNNDLERERGITIRAKHCTVEWSGYRINLVDTPGHADFSGEVERVLSMVDSVLLLVDANEGPMPQTRYVLTRALRLGYRPIVIVNKVDRPGADPNLALEQTFDLFLELGASDEQADFPVLYGSGLEGWLVRELEDVESAGVASPSGMDDLF